MPDSAIKLETLGWTPQREEAFAPCRAQGLQPGRIAVEDKHYYVVIAADGELQGQVAGKLLHETRIPDLPKVGDWVAFVRPPNEAKAVIQQIMPRTTKLSRKVAGREVQEQVLVANIDIAFAVQSLDRRFNLALLQRHLVMIFESGARPAVLLNKADLCQDLTEPVAQAIQVSGGTPVIAASAKTGLGLEAIQRLIQPGLTVAFIGTSGVGKSSLINALCGEDVQATAEVRESDAKGRHTTTWRELILLPNGGLVVDTPGMREFQMWVADDGLREAFADLDLLGQTCRFRDCTHTVERGCAVLEAVAQGQLSQERYQSYLKLKKELDYLEHAHARHAWMRKRQTRSPQRAFNRFKRSGS